MYARLALSGAAVATLALAVGAIGPAIGSDDDHRGDRDRHHHDRDTIRIISTNTEEHFVDVAPAGESLGDQFVFSADATDRKGRDVGHAGVVCTVVSTERGEAQCVGTASFERGQITFQGLTTEEAERFSLAITGGTGAYDDAEGELHVRQLDEERELVIFDLD